VAHHSFVGKYDGSKYRTIKGTIYEFTYGSRHIFFFVNVLGKGIWRVVAENISKTKSKGLIEKHLKPGTKVYVKGWPAKNGSPAIGLQSITLPDGKAIKIRSTAK